ncbi:hypothetical protein, partial [Thiolapillus sp.]
LGLELGLKLGFIFWLIYVLNAITFTVLSVHRTQRGSLIATHHSETNSEFNPNPNPKLGLELGLNFK